MSEKWHEILTACGVRGTTAQRWAPVFDLEVVEAAFLQPGELACFLGQVLHESGKLERVEEGLSYSAARLVQVWPKRFPTIESAELYERNPEALANKVYGGRMGNTRPGDGYRYRGRGLLQVTGRDNYRAISKTAGVDLEASPELLSEPAWALRASVAWWRQNVPAAAVGDVERVTRIVNGGTHGLDDRKRLTELAERALA